MSVGYLGTGHTGVLIDEFSTIRWLCFPEFDSPFYFASILNKKEGGEIRNFIADQNGNQTYFSEMKSIHFDYVGNYPLLNTVLVGEEFTIDIIDHAIRGGIGMVRKIHFWEEVPKSLGLEIKPIRGSLGEFSPSEHGIIFTIDGKYPLEIQFFSPIRIYASKIIFDTNGSKSHQINFYFKKYVPFKVPLNLELLFWEKFYKERVWVDFGGISEKVFFRSLHLLRNLIYQPTGALLAAATSSIPETRGLDDNWDYRYSWVRDNSFTVEAFAMTNCFEEAKQVLKFLFNVQGDDGHWECPFYTIEGKIPTEERILDLKEDYGGIIRVGNAAYNQLQIDSEGVVINAAFKLYQHSGDKEYLESIFKNLTKAARVILRLWDEPENGIWELREARRHYTYGKAILASALKKYCILAKILGKKSSDLEEYQETAQEIVKQIKTKCWSEKRKAFTQSFKDDQNARSEEIDMSVLALTLYEVISIQDPKMKQTISAILCFLSRRGGHARFEREKNPFYLSTLWLARHLLKEGRYKTFLDLLNICIECANDLGLMGEQFIPEERDQRGNIPQAFSHEEFVKAIVESYYYINENFDIVVPLLHTWTDSRIKRARYLGQELDLISYMEREKANCKIKVPKSAKTIIVPLKYPEKFELKGGKVEFYEGYAKITPKSRKLTLTYQH